MQPGQHIDASQRFLDDALMLESVGSHMGAAEMIWGATIQALEAIERIFMSTVNVEVVSLYFVCDFDHLFNLKFICLKL